MFNWLKERTKDGLGSRVHFWKSKDFSSQNMLVSDKNFFDENIKVFVFNYGGSIYEVDVPKETIVNELKRMAIGHFFTPKEAVGSDGCSKGPDSFRLVLVREARTLSDEATIRLENLIVNDELLLVERRKPNVCTSQQLQVPGPSVDDIAKATKEIAKHNCDNGHDNISISVDFKREFRRILLTLVEASVKIISADSDHERIFSEIFDRLEKKHSPKVDKSALKKLTEMGFDEKSATLALQLYKNTEDAIEWLTELSDITDNDADSIDTSEMKDTAQSVMHRFLIYRKKCFQPDPRAFSNLKEHGSDFKVMEALRKSGNDEKVALSILSDKVIKDDIDVGFERDSPIIQAMLSSHTIQIGLPKPKTLLALMSLCENSSNANIWLSDSDTHPVVSQILRVYHAEKHSVQSSTELNQDSAENLTSCEAVVGSLPFLRTPHQLNLTPSPGSPRLGTPMMYRESSRIEPGQSFISLPSNSNNFSPETVDVLPVSEDLLANSESIRLFMS